MSRTKEARIRKSEPRVGSEKKPVRLHLAPAPPASTPEPLPSALPSIATARIEALDGDVVHIVIGGEQRTATRDPSVHMAVLTGARDRGERVLCERTSGSTWVVIGALKVQPIPGIDVADTYTIEANRVVIRGQSEITLTTVAAGIAVRAIGEVESYAERIISRAEGVHKIVGRMLRLN